MNARDMCAFPSPEGAYNPETGRTAYAPEFGLTIRAYFAAKAMQGMLAQVDTDSSPATWDCDPVAMARKATECADALCDALGMKEIVPMLEPPF